MLEPPSSKLLPLNSRRLTTAHLRHIAGAMELLSTGLADEVRQLIEVKLQDEHEVRYVQVVLEETSFLNVKLSLIKRECSWTLQKPLETPVDLAELEHKLSEAEAQNINLTAELTDLQKEFCEQKEEVARLQELHTKSDGEIKKLKSELQKEKERSKQR